MTSLVRRASLLLVLLAACGSPGEGDDDSPPGPDGGPDDPPCVATGPEAPGDGVDNDCDGIVDELYVCQDGSQPFTTIAAAVAAAPEGQGVEVCPGVYKERLTITRSVRINGAGEGETIVDAEGGGGAFIVTGKELELAHLTIRNGRKAGAGGAVECTSGAIRVFDAAITGSRAEGGGGGLSAASCQVRVERVRFEGNEGVLAGGGARFVDSTGVIVDSTFSTNSADKGGGLALEGGAVDVRGARFEANHARTNGGALYQSSDSTVEASTFNGNTSGWTAGAVYVWQHAPTFRASHFEANKAEWEGGGFYLHQSHAVLVENEILANESFDDGGGLRLFESAARLERNMIANNKAVDGDGGGLKVSHVSSTFIDNQIMDNEALGAGGGVEFDNDSSVMRGGVIARNRSSIGGGVHVMRWPWNDGLLEGVRITGNHAWRGGGMYLEENFQPVTLRKLQIDDNTAHQGAGVYLRGTPLRMANTLVRENVASDVGGGFYTDPSASYPWDEPCPCPPLDPPATIAFTTIVGNRADAGEAVWSAAPNVTFASSIIGRHAGNAVTVVPGGQLGWRYNDTYPATFGGMGDPSGTSGNLAVEPFFMAVDDFHLQATSACKDAGDPAMTDLDGSRADMGIYGGPTPMN